MFGMFQKNNQEQKIQEIHKKLSQELLKIGFASPSVSDIADSHTSLYQFGDLIVNLVIQENGVVLEYLKDEGNGFYTLTGQDNPIKDNRELRATLEHIQNLARQNNIVQILDKLVLELRGKSLENNTWEIRGVLISVLATNQIFLLDINNTGQTFDNFDAKLGNDSKILIQDQENSQTIDLSKLNKGSLYPFR